MNLRRTLQLHRIVGPLALAIVGAFLVATVLAELSADHDTIRAVKRAILVALPLLGLAMAGGAVSGRRLSQKFRPTPTLQAKARRMPLIIANGLLVLVPSAFALDQLAQRGEFSSLFVAVQVLELIAGSTNFVLLLLMVRDGRAMARARRSLTLRPSALTDETAAA